MANNNYTEYGYRGVEEVKKLSVENEILKQNVFELQKQLQNAYKRNKELIELVDGAMIGDHRPIATM
jgi:hypothetical protein